MRVPKAFKSLRTIALVALMSGCIPAAASASSINFTGLGNAEIVRVEGIRNVTAWAGELDWSWGDGQPTGAQPNFYSYCVDLLNNELPHQEVTVGSTDSLLSDGMLTGSNHGAEKAAWLFNEYAAGVHSAFGASAMGAGLQLAIWNVLYDGDYTLSSGTNFRVASASAGALYFGNLFLSGLQGSDYLSASAMWLNSKTGAGQDQITMSPVPEPASLLLFGTGLAAMAAAARRKKAGLGSPAV